MYSVRRRMAYGSPALILAIVLLVVPAILQQLSADDCFPTVVVATQATATIRKVKRRRRRRGVRTRNLSRYSPQDLERPVGGVDAPTPEVEENVVVTEAAATNVRRVRRRRRRRGVRTRNLSRLSPRDLEMPVVGGFSPVPDFEKNAMITKAATFVLEEARNPSCTYSIGLSSSQDAADISTVRVVEASQQVVAGLNIRLMLAFEDAKGVCLGGCTVVVYNHFGDLTITNWSEESCKDLSRSGFETGHVEKDSAR
mmetsp:Transcript_622/g.1280  ORF Transcript_622/g.1280 Transcript_622/m.1280 type:complete len:255 (+) Transcript_622:226-990(+)